MSKENLKKAILKELKISYFGTSIKKLAENLNKSRTTIKKYLDVLETEGKVKSTDVGIYKIWVVDDIDSIYQDKKFQILSSQFYQQLLANLTEMYPDIIEKGKEIGRKIAPKLELEKIINFEYLSKVGDIRKKLKDDKFFLRMAMDLFDATNLIGDTYTIEPYVINPPHGFMTIKNSHFTDYPLYFHMIAGAQEQRIEDSLGVKINIDVHEVNPARKYVIIKYSIVKR